MTRAHCLVIGGTRGTGRALVRAWAAEGQAVSVIGRRPPVTADEQQAGVRYWTADLTDEDQRQKVLGEIVAVHGPVGRVAFFHRYRGAGDAWSGELETSLTATKRVIEVLVDRFDTAGGAIVIVGSIASRFVVDEQPLSYHVAKAGLDQMVRYYAVALGPRGIRVNGVSPSVVLKDESKDAYLRDDRLLALYRTVAPLGRLVTADDVALVVAFLAGPSASAVTGQHLVVDCGISLRGHESLSRRLTGLEHPANRRQRDERA